MVANNYSPLWIADYRGIGPFMAPGAMATQWTDGQYWDRSVFSPTLPLWDTRKGDVVSDTGPEKWDAADKVAFEGYMNEWFSKAMAYQEASQEQVFAHNNHGTNPYVLKDIFQRGADMYDKLVKIFNKEFGS